MAKKTVVLCDLCLNQKKETEAVVKCSLDDGNTWQDGDRWEDSYITFDLCADHATGVFKKMRKAITRLDQIKLCKNLRNCNE